jgi:hypothetical protein
VSGNGIRDQDRASSIWKEIQQEIADVSFLALVDRPTGASPSSILFGIHPLCYSPMSFYDSSSSVPHSPFSNPHRFPSLASLPYRLLLPTVRNPRPNSSYLSSSPPPPVSHKSPKIKSSSARSTRPRHASTSSQPTLDLHDSHVTIGQVWLGKTLNANFEIVHDQLELEGFQLFAVEKWSVSSSRLSLLSLEPNMSQGHREDEAHYNSDCLYR